MLDYSSHGGHDGRTRGRPQGTGRRRRAAPPPTGLERLRNWKIRPSVSGAIASFSAASERFGNCEAEQKNAPSGAESSKGTSIGIWIVGTLAPSATPHHGVSPSLATGIVRDASKASLTSAGETLLRQRQRRLRSQERARAREAHGDGRAERTTSDMAGGEHGAAAGHAAAKLQGAGRRPAIRRSIACPTSRSRWAVRSSVSSSRSISAASSVAGRPKSAAVTRGGARNAA